MTAALGQNATIWRGQAATLVFRIAETNEISAADWYCAQSAMALPAELYLHLTLGDGIESQLDGDDLLVGVELSPAQTETLPVGYAHSELWVVTAELPMPAAVGTLTVHDSLRN